MRRVLRRAIEVWNLHVMAGPIWEQPRTLLAARARLEDPTASSSERDEFEILGQRHARYRLDPRCVGQWSFAENPATPGYFDLLCETLLPRGAEAEVPPPIASRVGIGGRWLDEIAIYQGDSSYRGFPVEHHRAEVDEEGLVSVRTPALTVVQLFAMGVLPPIGGAVELVVGGETLGPMILADVRATDDFREDRIVLRFDPARPDPA